MKRTRADLQNTVNYLHGEVWSATTRLEKAKLDLRNHVDYFRELLPEVLAKKLVDTGRLTIYRAEFEEPEDNDETVGDFCCSVSLDGSEELNLILYLDPWANVPIVENPDAWLLRNRRMKEPYPAFKGLRISQPPKSWAVFWKMALDVNDGNIALALMTATHYAMTVDNFKYKTLAGYAKSLKATPNTKKARKE